MIVWLDSDSAENEEQRYLVPEKPTACAVQGLLG